MRKVALILILTAFAGIFASQVEVDLVLRNSDAAIRVTVPQGAFQMIDNQEILAPSDAENDESSPKMTTTEKYIPAAKCMLDNETEYEQFRKLWDIDSPASTQEQASLTEDLFVRFLITANYLDIQEEYAKRFGENMVKYGLFGTHSADIMDSKALTSCNLSYDTFCDLLYAFLRVIGFVYRITHPNIGQTLLQIESTNANFKNIDSNNYTGPFQTEPWRTVLYSELGPKGTQKKERNEAVFSWILSKLRGSSVDIQYFTNIASKDISDLKNTVLNLTKKNGKDAHVYVEGLLLIVDYQNHTSLTTVLQLVPDLSRLELSIPPPYTSSSADLSFLLRKIPLCKSLKSLKIAGQNLGSAVVIKLVEKLPNIEQLSLTCKVLEYTAIDKLRKCAYLETLTICGETHPSATVQALVTHLSFLKELSIKCHSLEPAAVECFETCTQLERLNLFEEAQPSDTVQALVNYLPFLKELSIVCDVLEPTAIESFKACKKLEKLSINGWYQPNTIVQGLVSHLPSLRELLIWCQSIDPAAAKCFETCTQLEKLSIYGRYQPSSSVQALVSHLPSLKHLNITCELLDPAAAKSFEACKNLEKLNIGGICQPSSSVQALVSHLPSLKELNIACGILEPAAAESFEACKQLEKLNIFEEYQPSSSVQALVSHLPSLKELTIKCNALEPEAAESFKTCKNLQKLYLWGEVQIIMSSFVKLIEALPSLQELRIEIETANPTFADALRKSPNLHTLDLTINQYHPGVLSHYLQDPLPSLAYLQLYNLDKDNKCSKEDTTAVEKARTMISIQIRQS
ncbi:hypothetical protein NECID01_1247 [Nematocida sp. AWRm77]|nr:hypothetical protein NECID01_1247 [Nematocida sp. AWRm77]